MYDELVATLRRQCVEMDCGNCNTCVNRQAAEVIEELSAIREEQKAQIILMAAEIGEQQPRWIPVIERLPIRGDRVLCFGDNGINIVDFVCGDKWCALPWFYLDGEQETGVAYWMPLPKPPKEEE